MERRSRSTTRKQNIELSQLSNNTLNRDDRHTSIGRSFPELPHSLAHRPGGDSRTLSPERKPPHNYGFPKTSPHHSMNKSGSYNVYTHGQPPPIPPPHGLSHAASAIALGVNGTNPVPTPPRAPVSSQRSPPKGGERIIWEYHQVLLERVPGYGFGIAVSGGRDNPHFTNGDPSIAISDVLKSGPAEGKLLINDRVITANNNSLEGVDYATAVQVLRDSGQSVNLVVKRRLVLPPTVVPNNNNTNGVANNANSVSSNPYNHHQNQNTNTNLTTTQFNPNMKVTLMKSNKKKDDFGLVLGCKIYIKQIMNASLADKEDNLSEGDILNSINGISLDGMSLKEAKKLVDSFKEKLDLAITKFQDQNSISSNNNANNGGMMEEKSLSNGHSEPVIKETETLKDNNHNAQLTPASALSTPSTVAVQQNTDIDTNFNHAHESDYGVTKRHSRSEDANERNSGPIPDPRFISFQKAGSVGIRLTGGNEVGIFVTAVQPGSPAAQQGLQPGDKILKVNDMDMKGVTREEAVLFLLSLQDQINLIAQYRRDEYDQIVALQKGDSFYIKAHFNYENPEKSEMSFTKSDVFHVVDTLHNGVVGSWQAFRMDPFLSGLGRAAEQIQKGVIPNKARAEEIATQQFNLAKKEQNIAEQSRGTSFFRRRKDKSGHHRRSKSLGKDHWEDLVWSESHSKFPAYERVSLRHPGFPRPVVIFGPVADLARERLLRDFPGKFASPQQAVDLKSNNKSGIVRLNSIREIMSKGKHALLDVTPNAVDKLNYAQFYPIVIFARADSKQTIKECRSGAPKKAHMSSKKLLEQCQKLEKLWNHVFTATITLANITQENQWYNKLTDMIDKQQTAPIWMSDAKPDESVADDFLFPMSSGISYNSSPESDGEFCEPETPRNMSRQPSEEPNLSRFNSDPNLANLEEAKEIKKNPPPPSPEKTENITNNNTSRRSHVSDSKYGFQNTNHGNSAIITNNESVDELPLPPHPNNGSPHRSYNSPTKNGGGPPPTTTNNNNTPNGPTIPPKIERHKKPSKSPREAGGSSSSGGINTNKSNTHSLDRPGPNHMKMSIYDAYDPYNSSPQYDSSQRQYKSRGGAPPPSEANNGYRTSNPDPGYRAPSLYESRDPGYRNPEVGYRSSASLHDPTYRSNYPNGYRYPDYKPVPPPKSAPYKPVPPPKPKNSTNGQPEGNYMNNGYASSSSLHYHSSNVNKQQQNPTGFNGNSRFNNDDVDSGQGSSLDRDYGLYNNGPHQGQGGGYKQPSLPPNHNKDQYYYNLPQHHGGHQQHQPPPHSNNHNGNGNSPPRRSEGLDLTNNREYRGSAFELYKKPLSEAKQPPPQQYYGNPTVAR